MKAKLLYLSIFYLHFHFIVIFILPITLRSFKALFWKNGLSFVCPMTVQVCRKWKSSTFSPYSIRKGQEKMVEGHGIGMALAQKIIRLHQGNIAVH